MVPRRQVCCSTFLVLVLFTISVSCDDLLLPIMQKANSSARTSPEEIQAVYDVMSATGNSWVTEIPDICNGRWHGIECSLDVNTNLLHVVSLSFGALSDDTAFPACSSDSFISPSIAKLVYLRRLFFYKCFNGNPQPISPHIGMLGARLESLVMRENGHVGAIPVELSNLTNVHTLDLHGNQLNFSIPSSLGNLSSIQRLDLSSNKLSGRIPETLGRLQNLIVLDLSDNQLQGEVPDEFGQFQAILLMDLSQNCLTGGIPASFGRLQTLQNLILRKNKLNSPIPESLGNISSLQVLVLSSSNIVGSIPKELGKLKSLKILHLQNNKLNGSIPQEILHLPQLSELNLALNSLSGPVPVSKEIATRLGKRLQLMNNTNLCFRSQEHEVLAGIEQCTDMDDYQDPSQLSLPAIIIPSEPSIKPISTATARSRISIISLFGHAVVVGILIICI